MNRLGRVLLSGAGLLAGFCIVTLGAREQPGRPQEIPRASDVLRVTVDLVQVDATVTDGGGRPVADLTAHDFEVLQDGKPQTISTFAYVSAGQQTTTEPDAASLNAPSPARPLTPDRVGRTIAIIVDDLGLSIESTARVREALRHFVDRSMQPGDLVAIVRTGAGMGALQQFTTDRRMLHAAADRVRWSMRSRATAFGAPHEADAETLQDELFTAGTLGAIRYVLRGVAALPGRKSVIVFSDGFRVTDGDGRYGHVLYMLRSVADVANRSGAVVYTIDARGLAATGPTAADVRPAQAEARRAELRTSQEGLDLLAADTGGLFIRDSNNLAAGLTRVLDDQRGYYLLGYVPEGSTFSNTRPRFHRLEVRVKRPGLRVRSRRGFLGRADQPQNAPTSGNRMVAAVTSPFAGSDIRLRLSSFFGHVEKIGPVVQSFMHVDARDLTFVRQPDNSRSGQLETFAVTFGDNGEIADQTSRTYTVTLSPERHAQAMQGGFVYAIRVPVKRPGPYQLRIALRDVFSDRIGSASYFIEVPDVRKGRLTLSGLLIQGASAGNSAPQSDGTVEEGDPKSTVAVRMFPQGSVANYVCYVYNARRGRAGEIQLESQARVLRDGVEVFRGTPQPVLGVEGAGHAMAAGVLQLGKLMPPGNYVLELTVTDKLPKKNARATQTIDFEVVE